VDPRQQRRAERRGRWVERPPVRGQLPRQPGDGARGGRRVPGGIPAFGRPGLVLRQRLGRRRRRRGRGDRQGTSAAYAPWVRSIREGAINFPTPKEARAYTWTEEDLELVADRVDTQFVGSPGQVADKLEQLRDATDADELLITTITHDHADRVRSYQLLANEWQRR
jgi:alkanesulfonate monooxygenase SsuD/methylene tetrahydromethanopterin reductase-like flavin-dependent oxidoreductase (luciferase family)